MNRLKLHLHSIKPVDIITMSFCLLLSFLSSVIRPVGTQLYWNLIINFGLIAVLFISVYGEIKTGSAVFRQIHLWYLVPFVLLTYKELHYIIEPLRGERYDSILILIDRLIFRTDPTAALYRIANPLLTEILQIIYGTFYFFPVLLGIDLLLRNKCEEFDYSALMIVYGFVLSYIGYILFPAIGPRFTIHNFEMNNIELPGLFLTDFLRELTNRQEFIPAGTPFPAGIVQRDAFPSGHTLVTLLVMYLAVKYKSRLTPLFITAGILLIFSTVYLRYHYFVDLIGGLLFMLFTIWSGKYIYSWWGLFIRSSSCP
jgi:membrane-associated phospholipid phosphatase